MGTPGPKCVQPCVRAPPGPKYVQWFKCITIGDVGVGKSCLMLQFTDRKFEPVHYPTVEVEFGTPIINIDDKPTKLQIWDQAGNAWFQAITVMYYRGAAAAILVYDVTKRETFDNVAKWLKDAEKLAPANLTIMLIGNKCDLSDRRAVSYEEGERLAKDHGLMFLETSAKTAQNVDEAFIIAARTVSKKIEDGVLDESAKFGGYHDLRFAKPTTTSKGVMSSLWCWLLQLSRWR